MHKQALWEHTVLYVNNTLKSYVEDMLKFYVDNTASYLDNNTSSHVNITMRTTQFDIDNQVPETPSLTDCTTRYFINTTHKAQALISATLPITNRIDRV